MAALPSFAEAVVKEMKRLDDTKPGVLSRVLLPILQSHVHQAPFCLPAKVRVSWNGSLEDRLANAGFFYTQAVKLSAEILEPTGESDNPLKFLAGFVLGVPMDAEITGLVADAHDYLRLRVKYPDQHTQLTIPQVRLLSPSISPRPKISMDSLSIQDGRSSLVFLRTEWSLLGEDCRACREFSWRGNRNGKVEDERCEAGVAPETGRRGRGRRRDAAGRRDLRRRRHLGRRPHFRRRRRQ